jgi:hypothetical protein
MTARSLWSGAWLLAAAILLFWNLGAYGLWDDEANTGIFAANVWQTGDTNAFDGTNIIGYRSGLELAGIKNRAYPPLQYFYAAPFIGALGRTQLGIRVPFALAALVALFLLHRWTMRPAVSVPMRWAVRLAVLSNVSLFLYSRQGRYYPLAWGLGLALAFCYVHRQEARRFRLGLIAASTALLAAHYLAYGAAMVCLAADWLFFESWRRKDSLVQLVVFGVSQVASLGLIVGIFFPFGRKVTEYVPADWWHDKLTLTEWNIRDGYLCEFFSLTAVALGLVVVLVSKFKELWVLRATLALGLYALMASILSVQPVGWASVSDIRYMVGAFPLGIFIMARVSAYAAERWPGWWGRSLSVGLALILAFVAWPRMFRGNIFPPETPVLEKVTSLKFVKELASPQRSAYREVSEWLAANVPAGAKVAVLPDYAVYPLMFHVPQLKYMWQFDPSRRIDYPMLEEHHFRGLGMPDVLVGFGPDVQNLRAFAAQTGQQWQETYLDVRGPDRTRPELFWRDFATVPVNVPQVEGSYILVRQP